MILTKWQMSPLGQDGYLGEVVSTLKFSPKEWTDVSLPGTSVAHLASAGKIDDPYFGTNMQKLPGYKAGRDTHFTFHPMPNDSPYRIPLWYRTTFESEAGWNDRVWLKFKGINFKADIWINGKRVAASSAVAGSYRIYDLDVTPFAKSGENSVAVQVWPQQPDDLGITFIDWSATPPDESAGIWQPVEMYLTKPACLKDPQVLVSLNKSYTKVDISVAVTIDNRSKTSFDGELRISIDGKMQSLPVSILGLDEERNRVKITLDNPDLWWPWDMGEQPLYSADIALYDDEGEEIGFEVETFGVREISSEINEHDARLFKINGKPILIRGSAWSPDLMLRQDRRRDEIDVAYLKEMNLNTVRLEGKLATDYFWDLCDEEGILVIAGWPCCTHWEQWEKWKPDDYLIAIASLKSQLKRLRNHASFICWMYGSDYPPIPKVEKLYLEVLAQEAPDLVSLSSAAQFKSKLTGPTGVKMSGPYGYVPPSYWYDNNMPGVATSFNTETGPDASFPRYESVRRMLPEDEQYVGSPSWNHHAGLASFLTTDVMNNGLTSRYGVSEENLEEFLDVAQIISYECWRGMYEAYGRNFPEGTGVVGWMQNGHWPSLIWQKYDYWMVPTGGFYGAQKACEQLHVQYSYDDDSLWIINSLEEDFSGELVCTVLNDKSEKKETLTLSVKVGSGERKSITKTPLLDEKLFFVDLRIVDTKGVEKARNFYWLSNQKDCFEPKQEKKWWYYRPLTETAEFSALLTLPKTELTSEIHEVDHTDSRLVSVTLTNNGETIAVAIQLDLLDMDGQIIAPVFWSENLLFLLPGESRDISARINHDDYSGDYFVKIKGRNCQI